MISAGQPEEVVVEVREVVTAFGDKKVHDGVTFTANRRKVTAIIGSSGTGKSVLLREIVGLLKPSGGEINVLGVNVWQADEDKRKTLRTRYGMLFQDGALFTNLTVGQNVAVVLKELTDLPDDIIPHIITARLILSGLEPADADKLPAELSGGMRKRAALARALSMEPELLFLDEPTSGLDPITSRLFDQFIRSLALNLGIGIIMTTHDLDTIESVVDHLVVLDSGKVLAAGSVAEVRRVRHPWVREYFDSRIEHR